MTDFYIDPTTGDCVVEGGMIKEVSGVAEMIQRIRIAIKTHLGEVLLDTDRGLPWAEEILIKGVVFANVASRARIYLMTIEGVTGIKSLAISMHPDAAVNLMLWDLDIQTTAGITGPFRVSVTL